MKLKIGLRQMHRAFKRLTQKRPRKRAPLVSATSAITHRHCEDPCRALRAMHANARHGNHTGKWTTRQLKAGYKKLPRLPALTLHRRQHEQDIENAESLHLLEWAYHNRCARVEAQLVRATDRTSGTSKMDTWISDLLDPRNEPHLVHYAQKYVESGEVNPRVSSVVERCFEDQLLQPRQPTRKRGRKSDRSRKSDRKSGRGIGWVRILYGGVPSTRDRRAVRRELQKYPAVMINAAQPIRVGSFGSVYSGFINGMPSVFKELTAASSAAARAAFFNEIILQNELFCRMRLQRASSATAGTVAKLAFVARVKGGTSSKERPIMGMEQLREAHPHFRRMTERQFFTFLLKMTRLLRYMHATFQFMHRDMHAQNVMCRSSRRLVGGTARAPHANQGDDDTMQPVLIDFGMSRCVLDGHLMNLHHGSLYSAAHGHTMNCTHDLRMFLFSLMVFTAPPAERCARGASASASVFTELQRGTPFWQKGHARRLRVNPHYFNQKTQRGIVRWLEDTGNAILEYMLHGSGKDSATFCKQTPSGSTNTVFHLVYHTAIRIEVPFLRPSALESTLVQRLVRG